MASQRGRHCSAPTPLFSYLALSAPVGPPCGRQRDAQMGSSGKVEAMLLEPGYSFST